MRYRGARHVALEHCSLADLKRFAWTSPDFDHRTLPPEILLAGARHSQEVKCLAFGQAERSVIVCGAANLSGIVVEDGSLAAVDSLRPRAPQAPPTDAGLRGPPRL